MRNVSTQHHARGYTLLELLLALGLSGILMVAVYASLAHYWRLSSVGKIDAERMQLARSLVRRMAIDIRSIVDQPEEEEEVVTEDEESEDGTVTMTTEDAASTLTVTARLVGTSTSLTLVAVRPTRNRVRLATAEDLAVQDSQSDLRRLTYSFGGGTATEASGLYFSNVDQREAEWSELQGVAMTDVPTELLAAEVISLQFQYLDGNTSTWVDDWHSIEYAGLPRAIRVSMQFAPASAADSEILASSRTSPTTEYVHFTIDLPAASLPEAL